MFAAELKPLITALLLPPASPLLLVMAGMLLRRRNRAACGALVIAGVLATWLLACNVVAVQLARTLLPATEALPPAQAPQLRAKGVQAIVVLGGGMESHAVEYGRPQLAAVSLTRLRYGAWLARQSGLPLAFSGGIGWSSVGTDIPAEAQGAGDAAMEWGTPLRWAEDQSRDTVENAQNMYRLLQADHVAHIALVTHAWHMPRAQKAFEQAGFIVVAAPMGYIRPLYRDWLEWLPSAEGLAQSRTVLREWLGLRWQNALAIRPGA